MDENLINRIISAAYGDIGFRERIRIRKIIRNNPEAERLYNSYREVADKVHSMDTIKCPDEVLVKAEKKIMLQYSAKNILLKPALAFTIIFIAAVTALFTLINKPEPTYSAAEVKTAEAQAKESLALVGRILNKTTETLGNEILPEKVSKPVKEGFNIINNLLIGG